MCSVLKASAERNPYTCLSYLESLSYRRAEPHAVSVSSRKEILLLPFLFSALFLKSTSYYISVFPSFWVLAQSVFMMSQCLSLSKFTLHGNESIAYVTSPFGSHVWHVLRLVSKETETNVQQVQNMRGFQHLLVSLTIY